MQPKKKTSIITWFVLGFIIMIVLVGITANDEENDKTTKSGAVQLQQQVSKIVKFVNSLNGLKLRTQPSLSADVLEVLKDKAEVEVLKEQKDWSEVRAGEKQGWVASKYLITSHEKMMMWFAETAEKEREEMRKEADFRVTAEEIYSNFMRCQKDPSFEDVVRKKYDSKIVEITGTVDKAEDIIEVHKNSIGRSTWVELHGETLPPIIQELVDEGRRYYICLADNEGHACVAWVYSSSSQLISKVKKGDRITVIGRWEYIIASGGVPDLKNSEVRKIY